MNVREIYCISIKKKTQYLFLKKTMNIFTLNIYNYIQLFENNSYSSVIIIFLFKN